MTNESENVAAGTLATLNNTITSAIYFALGAVDFTQEQVRDFLSPNLTRLIERGEQVEDAGRARIDTAVDRSRQAVTDTAHCFVIQRTDDRLDRMVELANAKLDRWFALVDGAEPVPPADRLPLAARDLAFRRAIAERDPANEMGERYFGTEMTDRLVRGLWGGDRVLPRPGTQA